MNRVNDMPTTVVNWVVSWARDARGLGRWEEAAMRQRCDAERGIEAASLFGMNLENVPLHPPKRVFLLQLSSMP